MRLSFAFSALGLVARAAALGSSCSSPLGSGNAAPGAAFWMQTIQHQGSAPYAPNSGSYTVFRNVKNYGAKGDGSTDDTAAINAAISDGNRCAANCDSSTTTPAVVFFPSGTYKVSTPINVLYYTQLIGDARNLPTILAASNFGGMAVIDANPSNNGNAYYTPQNNFYRSVRNFVIDLRQTPVQSTTTAIHWRVSQATSLMNIRIEMAQDSSTGQQGMYMEDGSGGYMGDLIINGGKNGLWLGNQQFTVRNVTINNAQTGIYIWWAWGWTFQDITFNNCQVGFDLHTGGTTSSNQPAGAVAIIDGGASNTPIFLRTTNSLATSESGTVVLDNIHLSNVGKAVYDNARGVTVLAGTSGSTTIAAWAQGSTYQGENGVQTVVQGNIPAPNKAGVLLDGSGRMFGRSHPQYEGYSASQFVSVKANGAKGDGNTDDTAAIKAVLAQYAGCKIIFFDAGIYMVSSTITIPAGTQVVGEAWSVIMGFGSAFQNAAQPQVVVQAGAPGSSGVLEITDMVFSTRGPTPGAIVVEWNAHDPAGQQGVVGTWDTHIRLGGAQGTNLGGAQCATSLQSSDNCFAAFMGLHLTSGSSAYIEGMWVWLGDHELDNNRQQVTVYSGRGILSESQGPVWFIGTASEHHVMYQYGLIGAQNHYMGLIQTETPYYEAMGTYPTSYKKRSIEAPAPARAAKSSKRGVELSIPVHKTLKRHFDEVAPTSKRTESGAFRHSARHSSPFAHGHNRRRITKRDTIPAGWASVGCIEDASTRVLGADTLTSASLTISSCIDYCSSKGYTMAGVEDGNQCFCANSYTGSVVTATSTDCSMTCAGDSTETCGGGWRLNVYGYTKSTGSALPTGWSAAGCVVDQAARVLAAATTTSTSMTTGSCISYCSSKGYTIAGTEASDECYCANSYSGGTPVNAPAGDCNWTCVGDSTEDCGGGWRLNLYTSSPTTTPPPTGPPTGWTSAGCIVDTQSRVLASDTFQASNLTTASCISYCSSRGYSLAGTEDGNECHCGSSYNGGTPATAPTTDCATKCTGDLTEECGGNWRLNLYTSTPTTTPPPSGLPTGWTSTGCIVDSNTRVLPSDTFQASNLTTASCIAYCSSRGYSLAGTEDGNECHCANSYTGGTPTTAPATDCATSCSGDSTEDCGGGWRLSVYTSSSNATSGTIPAGWTSGGCIVDSASRVLPSANTSSPNMTTAVCVNYCASHGYSLAGTENYQECWCSNSYNGGPPTAAPITDCDQPCNGDPTQDCGGGWRMNLYTAANATNTTSPANSTIPVGWSSGGCIIDSASRVLASATTSSPNMTTAMCVNYCSSLGYSLAGTENYDECHCASSYSGGTPTTAPLTDCNQPCTGDPTEDCGGGWRLNLYTQNVTTSPGLPTGWVSAGCYIDFSTRILGGYSTTSTNNTPSSCVTTCAGKGYTIAGTEYGDECHCANYYNGGMPAAAIATDCNVTCSGDPKQSCGAGWRLNVYTLSTAPPPRGPFAIDPTYHDPSPLPSMAYALYVRSSQNILVYGAGMYSFFQDYSQSCLNDESCQSTITSIDKDSSISIMSLSTVGVAYMLDVNGVAFAAAASNQDGFQQTLSVWTP